MIGSMSMIDAIAIVTAAILLALAGLHVYWLSGRTWPGHDAASLNAMVIGGRPGAALPPRPMTALVSAGLVGIAIGALAARGLVAPPFPGAVRALTWVAASVLALRGIGGFFDRWMRPHTAELPFARLNVRIYSPLALALAAGLGAALLG